MSNKPRQN